MFAFYPGILVLIYGWFHRILKKEKHQPNTVSFVAAIFFFLATCTASLLIGSFGFGWDSMVFQSAFKVVSVLVVSGILLDVLFLLGFFDFLIITYTILLHRMTQKNEKGILK